MTKYEILLAGNPRSLITIEADSTDLSGGDLVLRNAAQHIVASFGSGHWIYLAQDNGVDDDKVEWGEPFDVDGYAESSAGAQIPGPVRMRVHKKRDCQGRHCVIHNPSDHHMVGWMLNWRADRGLMERVCEHGIGHPDPDDIAYKSRSRGTEFARAEAVHGCDGCCSTDPVVNPSRDDDPEAECVDVAQARRTVPQRLTAQQVLATFGIEDVHLPGVAPVCPNCGCLVSDHRHGGIGLCKEHSCEDTRPNACTCSLVGGPTSDCPQHGADARWAEVPPQAEGQCSYFGCQRSTVWTRKPGWIVAPGSPPGDVCEAHHCWEPIS